eukprot:CAMPEP_0198260310 /NCGR_PEP_ID=MMETSP1447-20131203/9319_1 /TAXON_ID=420782 /ORGANISM="Chaetoceros dichaeta, Strain CCMP1751" /LENGTH=137 /DNA_ID=CAMNT_0043947941 /DNA_START=167 /DNA_END=583 /DNA_ORIENTATION=-
MTSSRSSEDFGVMSHCRDAAVITNSQTVFEDDSIAESSFNGGIISLSSSSNSSTELPDMLPLDYRLGLSIADDNMKYSVPRNVLICMNNAKLMDMDSLCGRPNEWKIESVCGDSIDTEEDMSSISEWINSDNDFWQC